MKQHLLNAISFNQVPVVKHGDNFIADSNKIIKYLDQNLREYLTTDAFIKLLTDCFFNEINQRARKKEAWITY